MNLADITTKSYILTMLIRDDGERFLLGDGAFEFKDSQQHFQPNTYANDVVELQGTDGQMLAGQVRRTATQTWNGYIGDATTSKQQVEQYRRSFFLFFRPRHYYTAVYIFCDGSAIQRKRGYIVNAPSAPELWQKFPEWSIGLNFEDPNYYEYAEDDEGNETYAHAIAIALASNISGGLVWDAIGAITNDLTWRNIQTLSGTYITMNNALDIPAKLSSFEMAGNTWQQTYSGKNLFDGSNPFSVTGYITHSLSLTAGTYTFSASAISSDGTAGLSLLNFRDSNGTSVKTANLNHTDKKVTFTLAQNTADVLIYSQNNYAASAGKSTTFTNLMLESGNQQTVYEPYVGGTASPNPDYPQGVSTTTGENVLSITGKNLINQGQYGTGHTAGGIIADFTSDAITMSGTSTSGAWPSFTMYADGSFLQQSWWPTTSAIDTSKGAFNDTGNYRFTIWIDGNRGTAASNFRYIIGYMDGTVTNAYFPLDDASYSFTITKPINFISVGTANSVTVDCSVRIQLEKGTSGSSFEPYQNKKQEINLGKNLFTGQWSQFDNQGGTGTAYAYFKLPDDGDYTLTLIAKNAVTGTSTTYLGFTFTGGSTTNPRYWAFENGQSVTVGQKISISNYGGGQMLHYVSLYSKSSDTLDWFMENFDIQLEKGSTATDYAPYFTPYELAKIGTYQDRIYKDDGKWYIEKQVGKVVLDGTESWSLTSGSVRYSFWVRNSQISGMLDEPHTKACDNFTYSSSAFNVAPIPSLCENSIPTTPLTIFNTYGSQGTTVAQWQTWLASNPTTVYYALATPTTTEITSQALIDQLEASLATKLYVGQNNITTEVVEGNQKATLNLGYYTEYDEDGGGYEWEDGGSPRNIITIDGVDSAMPIWKVNGPATNPTLTNITTGQTITWTGFVPSGQTLTIDMGEMTASLAGANVFEYVSGEWIELQSGNNLITYTAQGGATDPSTLEWNGVAG